MLVNTKRKSPNETETCNTKRQREYEGETDNASSAAATDFPETNFINTEDAVEDAVDKVEAMKETTQTKEYGNKSYDANYEKMIIFLTGKSSQERSRYAKAIKFPSKLFYIIGCGEFNDCIAWTSDGTGFTILDLPAFTGRVLSVFFVGGSKFTSFHRKLNRWSFIKVPGAKETYSHTLFRRGELALCQRITCTGVRGSEEMDGQLFNIPSSLLAAAGLGPGQGGMMLPHNPTTSDFYGRFMDNHHINAAAFSNSSYGAHATSQIDKASPLVMGMGEGSSLSSSSFAGQSAPTFQPGNLDYLRSEILRSSTSPGKNSTNAMQDFNLRRIEHQLLGTGLGTNKQSQLEEQLMMLDRNTMAMAQANGFLGGNQETSFSAAGNHVPNQRDSFLPLPSSSMDTRTTVGGEGGMSTMSSSPHQYLSAQQMPSSPHQYLSAQQMQLMMQQTTPMMPMSMMPSVSTMINQMMMGGQDGGMNHLQHYPMSSISEQDPHHAV